MSCFLAQVEVFHRRSKKGKKGTTMSHPRKEDRDNNTKFVPRKKEVL